MQKPETPKHAYLDQLDALATQLEHDADASSGIEAVRMRSLGATIKSYTAKLR